MEPAADAENGKTVKLGSGSPLSLERRTNGEEGSVTLTASPSHPIRRKNKFRGAITSKSDLYDRELTEPGIEKGDNVMTNRYPPARILTLTSAHTCERDCVSNRPEKSNLG